MGVKKKGDTMTKSRARLNVSRWKPEEVAILAAAVKECNGSASQLVKRFLELNKKFGPDGKRMKRSPGAIYHRLINPETRPKEMEPHLKANPNFMAEIYRTVFGLADPNRAVRGSVTKNGVKVGKRKKTRTVRHARAKETAPVSNGHNGHKSQLVAKIKHIIAGVELDLYSEGEAYDQIKNLV